MSKEAKKDLGPQDSVSSTSDERVKNNVMRHEYRVLTDDEKRQMKEVNDLGLAFVEKLEEIGQSAELTISRRSMEVAVFWAVKHITQ